MEAITNLSKDETAHLNAMKEEYNLDSATFAGTLRLYREMRQLNCLTDPSIPQSELMKVALLVAEKSIAMWTVDGQRIRGPTLSLCQAVKAAPLQLVRGLRLFAHSSKHAATHAQGCLSLANTIEFAFKYSQLLQEMLATLEFEGAVYPIYKDVYKAFAWVLFLDSATSLRLIPDSDQTLTADREADGGHFEKNQKIEQNENFKSKGTLSENKVTSDCQSEETALRNLLVAVIYTMIMRSYQCYRPKTFEKCEECPYLNRSLVSKIHSRLFLLFDIKDIPFYKHIANQFDLYLEALVTQHILHPPSFLQPNAMYRNYHKINQKFEAEHHRTSTKNTFSFDMRVFLRTLTPLRNPKLTPHRPLQSLSKKILTYDENQYQLLNSQSTSMCSELIPSTLPSTLLTSSNFFLKKIPLLCANTFIKDIELKEYICCVKKSCRSSLFRIDYVWMQSVLNKISRHQRNNQEVTDSEKSHCEMHSECKTRSIEEIADLAKSYSTILLECSAESIVAVAIEIVFFANIGSNEDRFNLLSSEVCPVSLYRVVNALLQTNLPSKLNFHLNILCWRLVRSSVWECEEMIEQMHEDNKENAGMWSQRKGRSRLQEMMKSETMASVMKAMEYHLESRIERLAAECGVEGMGQHACRCAIEMCRRYPDLLKGKHLDVIALCSMYITAKTHKIMLTFNHLIKCYETCVGEEEFKAVIKPAAIQQHLLHPYTIIDFYNHSFVPVFQHFYPSFLRLSVLERTPNSNLYLNHSSFEASLQPLQSEEIDSEESNAQECSVSNLQNMNNFGDLNDAEHIYNIQNDNNVQDASNGQGWTVKTESELKCTNSVKAFPKITIQRQHSQPAETALHSKHYFCFAERNQTTLRIRMPTQAKYSDKHQTEKNIYK